MSKTKSPKAIIKEYNDRYGDIPLRKEEILEFILNKYKRIDLNIIKDMEEEIKKIPWETETYIIPLIPKPAHRPRYSFETKHFYVPGASTNKTIMKQIVGISDNLIMAKTSIVLDIYQPTPCYKMTQNEIYLAELGYIQPVIDPDVDNFAKAYLDAIQGVLIADDNIITNSEFNKYFSIKPRIELKISYQTKPESNYTKKILDERMNKIYQETNEKVA